MWKDDIKKAKISVEGADVEITNVVFHWKEGKDKAITNVGVVKSGGQTAGGRSRHDPRSLPSPSIQILNDKPTTTIEVWGFD